MEINDQKPIALIIKIATSQGIYNENVINEFLNYEEFKTRITSFQVVEQYYSSKGQDKNGQTIILDPKDALIEALKTAKNRLPWFIAGHFEKNKRTTENLFSRSLIVLDVDYYQY